ncbi:MAG TPA: hypothetical protein VFN88_01235, partial [Caulobacteraceae bacterium]|nr:hypothetical protein [Caulobacteraceae bacterium]
VDRTGDETLFGTVGHSDAAYEQMLPQARSEHPKAWIVVVRDRNARSGFSGPALELADEVIDGPFDPHDLIALGAPIYTMSALIGLEACFAGRQVTVLGDPFWKPLSAPAVAAPPIEALFAVCYLNASRYSDPLTGQGCSAEIAFERMAAMRRHARRVSGRWVGLNIPPPKNAVVSDFLSGPLSAYRDGRQARGQERPLVWASRLNAAAKTALETRPDGVVRVEDGFLRSVGLGAAFTPASSLVLDTRGIYYDPEGSSDLRHILETARFDPPLIAQAARLRARIGQTALTKYNLSGERPALPAKRGSGPMILIPGQVENDASVISGGLGLGNLALLRRVRAENPDATILFKAHPDVRAGYRPGAISRAEALELADALVPDAAIDHLIRSVDEVHTLTSLTGFEALLRGTPVTTYGRPFYAGWGLTRDLGGSPLTRALTLDELVAGALILYPLYLDPISRLPCDALTFVDRLEEARHRRPAASGRRAAPALRYLAALVQTFRSRRAPLY